MTEQPVRYTADTITDNALDQLYTERDEARAAADRYFTNGTKAVEELNWRAHNAEQRAEQAEAKLAALKRAHVALAEQGGRDQAAIARVRALHRPAEHMGRIICAECSAYCGESTDNAPVFMPCSTVAALDELKEPRP